MKCDNLGEKALLAFRSQMNKNQLKIKKTFEKKFGCEVDLENIRIDHEDTVNFIFDDFEIMGMYSCKCVHFHFHTKTFVRWGLIETIEDLGYFVNKYITKKTKTTVDVSLSLDLDEDYIFLMEK